MQSHFICFVFAGLKFNIAIIPYSLAIIKNSGFKTTKFEVELIPAS
jgi:hypothetical protein